MFNLFFLHSLYISCFLFASPGTESVKKKKNISVCFLAETHLLIETRQLKELNISRDKDFTIPCHLTKQASNESQFQVTWFWQEDTESDMRKAIFTVYRNSTLQSSFEEVDLRFSHPGESIFSLTVLKPSPQHSGLYFCEVEEWLPSLPQEWRRVTTATSEKLNVTVTGEGKDSLMIFFFFFLESLQLFH